MAAGRGPARLELDFHCLSTSLEACTECGLARVALQVGRWQTT
jgi:hypothetical protein